MSANEPCIRWGPRCPMGRGNFEGKERPIVRCKDSSAVSCAKTAELIEMLLGMWTWVGPRKHEVHIGASWLI